jgi:hypothetical protein
VAAATQDCLTFAFTEVHDAAGIGELAAAVKEAL